ncbi:mitochondrial protein Pet127-domain-containing protein [Amylocarpus encephaloides]|uniref:Mitochondrial protein Pet127-domain-containing protein n=1 Tax=Amylocarpus encephaloides TaxID=45428 RepID=A0A9P7YFU7_9HELO|nr:mitochondrial protein Pet127-domain-containing protein [Amylocarpus encephaloides]
MFTTLSRRGTRVNHSYVCSFCLTSLLAHSEQSLTLTPNRVPRIQKNPFSSTPSIPDDGPETNSQAGKSNSSKLDESAVKPAPRNPGLRRIQRRKLAAKQDAQRTAAARQGAATHISSWEQSLTPLKATSADDTADGASVEAAISTAKSKTSANPANNNSSVKQGKSTQSAKSLRKRENSTKTGRDDRKILPAKAEKGTNAKPSKAKSKTKPQDTKDQSKNKPKKHTKEQEDDVSESGLAGLEEVLEAIAKAKASNKTATKKNTKTKDNQQPTKITDSKKSTTRNSSASTKDEGSTKAKKLETTTQNSATITKDGSSTTAKKLVKIPLSQRRTKSRARTVTVRGSLSRLHITKVLSGRKADDSNTTLTKTGESKNVEEADFDRALTTLRKTMTSKLSRGKHAESKSLSGSSIKEAMRDTTRSVRSTTKRDRVAAQKSPHGQSVQSIEEMKLRIAGKGLEDGEIETISTENLHLVAIDKKQPPVPALSYGLDRVLFNPGVYHLQDPRSKVFNFDPYLQTIMPVDEFDFTLLKKFITSSKDENLLQVARDEKKKYTGSTSSMTSALSHFHYLLSQWRPINDGNLSKNFPAQYSSFTALQRGPSAMFLRYNDGVYAIDADKQFDSASILSMLGQSMEKLLTLSTDDFERYRKNSPDPVPEEVRKEAESYHYTTMRDFMMRSQLDAYDPRIPGTGMFDLKTRAVVSIRMNTSMYEDGRGYEIKSRHGEWESFEREYYDMIRAAFLKYSLQVRIGRMDGIFVAFHNTQRIFGFQYISLPEMDYALHGTDNMTLGDSEFKLSLDLLNRVFDRATTKWPKQSLRIFIETRGKADEPTFTYIFAEPVTEHSIEDIQTSNKASIEEFEKRVLGIGSESEEETKANWEDLQAKVKKSMDLDENDSDCTKETSNTVDDDADEAPPTPWDLEQEDINELDEAEEYEAGNEAHLHHETAEEHVFDLEQDDNGSVTPDTESGGEDVEVTESTLQETDNTSEQEVSASIIEESGEESIKEKSDAQGCFAENVESALSVKDDGLVPKDTTSKDTCGATSVAEQTDDAALLGDDAEISEDATVVDDAKTSDETSAPQDSEDSSSKDTKVGEERELSDDDKLASEVEQPRELMAMYLTIRNKVNGIVCKRPINLTSDDKWEVEYSLAEVKDPKKASTLYAACKRRRKQILDSKPESDWNNRFIKQVMSYAEKGREYRKKVDAAAAQEPIKVLTIKPEDLQNLESWTENGKEQEARSRGK